MVLKEKYDNEYLFSCIEDFYEKYNDILDDLDIDFLKKECNSGLFFNIVPYLLTQFYNEYDLINPNQNIYIGILNKLKEVFELKKKEIIEIGGGPIPTLGRLLAEETTKNVTIYDPNITIKNNNTKNLQLVKKLFLPYTDINKYDIVVSFMACGAQESILYNCSKNNKDFFIGICPCGKEMIGEVFNKSISNKDYIDGIIEFAEKKVKSGNLGELIIDELEDKYYYPFPIIYNKRPKIIEYKKR